MEADRPEFMAVARRIAHNHVSRCSGGATHGDDGVRYHSKKCDELTADIYTAMRGVEYGSWPRKAVTNATE